MSKWNVGFAVFVLVIGGCDKKSGGVVAGGSATEASKAGPAAPDPSEEAIGTGITAFNQIIAPTGRAAKQYMLNIDDPKAGPRLDKMMRNWCSTCVENDAGYKDAGQLIEKIKKAPPAGSMASLPDKLDAMYKTSAALLAVLADIKSYYGAEMFKDDKGAKGQELHKAYMEKADAYRATVKAVTALLDAHDKETLEKDLAKYAANKDVHYYMRKCYADAKTVLDAFKNDDKDAVAKASTEYTQCVADYSTWLTGLGDKASQPLKGYQLVLNNYAAQVTTAVRDFNDPKTPSYTLDGDSQGLSQQYNGVVQVTNGLMDQEAQGTLK